MWSRYQFPESYHKHMPSQPLCIWKETSWFCACLCHIKHKTKSHPIRLNLVKSAHAYSGNLRHIQLWCKLSFNYLILMMLWIKHIIFSFPWQLPMSFSLCSHCYFISVQLWDSQLVHGQKNQIQHGSIFWF